MATILEKRSLIPAPPTGVLTDAKIIQYFYACHGMDVQTIATTKFIQQTGVYNEPWLVRELAQNWLDHNPHAPGTLNGVRIKMQYLSNKTRRFSIEGDWPFVENTGLYALLSQKPDNRQSAGGNGIGLKQVALRFLRDMQVTRFEIIGEGWKVIYRLALAVKVNQYIQRETDISYVVQNDWLIAEIRQFENYGKCAYIIETKNEGLIRALKQLNQIGVSHENAYLIELDVVNEYGGLKWLPVRGKKTPQGRLFVNGQAMDFKERGQEKTCWQGPELVTIQLNNISYNLSIDRPPISPYVLQDYLRKFIRSLSSEELIKQIFKSEYIWSLFEDKNRYSERWGCFVVIESIVEELHWRRDILNFEALFPQQYVADSDRLTDDDKGWLSLEGYTLCPSFFEKIGMASALSKLGLLQAGKNSKPRLSEDQRTRIAADYGLQVAYKDLSGLSVHDFFAALCAQGAKQCSDTTFRIPFSSAIPADLLMRSLTKPKDDTQDLLYAIRGIVKYGLENQIFKEIVLFQGEYLTTFSLSEDMVEGPILIARNIPHKGEQADVFLEFNIIKKYVQAFLTAFRKQLESAAVPAGEDHTMGVAEKKIQESAHESVTSVQIRVQTPSEQLKTWQAAVQLERITGKPLMTVISEHSQVKIPQRQQIKHLTPVQEPVDAADVVEDFLIIANPLKAQITQSRLLADYVSLATGVELNVPFIFQGRGAYGINIKGRAMGLHEALLAGDFSEALITLMHELAHNVPESDEHGPLWRHALDTLWGILWSRVNDEHYSGNLRLIFQQWEALQK